MRRWREALVAFLVLWTNGVVAQQYWNASESVIVLRVGQGSASTQAAPGTALPVYIDSYRVAGNTAALNGSIAVSGCALSYNSWNSSVSANASVAPWLWDGEGGLFLSSDGKVASFPCWGVPMGSPMHKFGPDSISRVLALVNADGTVSTSVRVLNGYGGISDAASPQMQLASAVMGNSSLDGIWMVGNGPTMTSGGIRYVDVDRNSGGGGATTNTSAWRARYSYSSGIFGVDDKDISGCTDAMRSAALHPTTGDLWFTCGADDPGQRVNRLSATSPGRPPTIRLSLAAGDIAVTLAIFGPPGSFDFQPYALAWETAGGSVQALWLSDNGVDHTQGFDVVRLSPPSGTSSTWTRSNYIPFARGAYPVISLAVRSTAVGVYKVYAATPRALYLYDSTNQAGSVVTLTTAADGTLFRGVSLPPQNPALTSVVSATRTATASSTVTPSPGASLSPAQTAAQTPSHTASGTATSSNIGGGRCPALTASSSGFLSGTFGQRRFGTASSPTSPLRFDYRCSFPHRQDVLASTLLIQLDGATPLGGWLALSTCNGTTMDTVIAAMYGCPGNASEAAAQCVASNDDATQSYDVSNAQASCGDGGKGSLLVLSPLLSRRVFVSVIAYDWIALDGSNDQYTLAWRYTPPSPSPSASRSSTVSPSGTASPTASLTRSHTVNTTSSVTASLAATPSVTATSDVSSCAASGLVVATLQYPLATFSGDLLLNASFPATLGGGACDSNSSSPSLAQLDGASYQHTVLIDLGPSTVLGGPLRVDTCTLPTGGSSQAVDTVLALGSGCPSDASSYHCLSIVDDMAGCGDGRQSRVSQANATSRYYYAVIQGYGGSTGWYTLSLNYTQPTPSKTPSGSTTPSNVGTLSASPTRSGTPSGTGASSVTSSYSGTGSCTSSSTGSGTSSSSTSSTATASGSGSGTASSTSTATGTGSVSASATGSLTASRMSSATGSLSSSSTGTAAPTVTITSSSSGSSVATSSSSGTSSGTTSATSFSTVSSSASTSATPAGSLSAVVTASGSGTGSCTSSGTASSTTTGSGSPSASAASTSSSSRSGSATSSPSSFPSASTSISGSASGTPVASASVWASPTASGTGSSTYVAASSVTASPSASGTASITATGTATVSGSPSVAPSSSVTASASATSTGTGTPPSSGTAVSSVTGTATASGSPTAMPSSTTSGTGTTSRSLTVSASVTASSSQSLSPEASVSATATRSLSASDTASGTASASLTASTTVSRTGTATVSGTGTDTPSAASTASSSRTASASWSASSVSTPTATAAVSVSGSSAATSTSTASSSGSFTPPASSSVTSSSSITSTAAVTTSVTASSSNSLSASATLTRSLSASPLSSASSSASQAVVTPTISQSRYATQPPSVRAFTELYVSNITKEAAILLTPRLISSLSCILLSSIGVSEVAVASVDETSTSAIPVEYKQLLPGAAELIQMNASSGVGPCEPPSLIYNASQPASFSARPPFPVWAGVMITFSLSLAVPPTTNPTAIVRRLLVLAVEQQVIDSLSATIARAGSNSTYVQRAFSAVASGAHLLTGVPVQAVRCAFGRVYAQPLPVDEAGGTPVAIAAGAAVAAAAALCSLLAGLLVYRRRGQNKLRKAVLKAELAQTAAMGAAASTSDALASKAAADSSPSGSDESDDETPKTPQRPSGRTRTRSGSSSSSSSGSNTSSSSSSSSSESEDVNDELEGANDGKSASHSPNMKKSAFPPTHRPRPPPTKKKRSSDAAPLSPSATVVAVKLDNDDEDDDVTTGSAVPRPPSKQKQQLDSSAERRRRAIAAADVLPVGAGTRSMQISGSSSLATAAAAAASSQARLDLHDDGSFVFVPNRVRSALDTQLDDRADRLHRVRYTPSRRQNPKREKAAGGMTPSASSLSLASAVSGVHSLTSSLSAPPSGASSVTGGGGGDDGVHSGSEAEADAMLAALARVGGPGRGSGVASSSAAKPPAAGWAASRPPNGDSAREEAVSSNHAVTITPKPPATTRAQAQLLTYRSTGIGTGPTRTSTPGKGGSTAGAEGRADAEATSAEEDAEQEDASHIDRSRSKRASLERKPAAAASGVNSKPPRPPATRAPSSTASLSETALGERQAEIARSTVPAASSATNAIHHLQAYQQYAASAGMRKVKGAPGRHRGTGR